MSRIPTDDDELEMEELEDLISVNTQSSSAVGSKASSNNQSLPSEAAAKMLSTASGLLSANTKNKFLSLALLIAVTFFIFVSEGELDVIESAKTGVSDTELKVGGSVDNLLQPEPEQPNVVDASPDPTNVLEDPKKDSTPEEPKGVTDTEQPKEDSPGENAAKDDKDSTVEAPADVTKTANESAEEPKEDKPAEEENTPTNDETTPKDDEAKKEELIAKWGKWGFWDGAEEIRPKEDYCGKYPNRDISENDFPEDAWQTDAVYVNHYLDAAANIVSRAMEAIYEEYGHTREGLDAHGRVERAKMFAIHMVDFEKDGLPNIDLLEGGGWTTKKSFEGLVRRLLHAMMTNDTFTVVLGGHSAAAGHGNHFHQSYMMQFHKVLEPIFNRLGVKLITRNIAQGGLGTLQGALGSGSIYGNEVDVIVWDSSMTEKSAAHIDLFERQAILGGNRAPFLLGGDANIMKALHENADADVGQFGSGLIGIAETIDEEQVNTLPWAAQYLKCNAQNNDLCRNPNIRFRTKCWVDRPDVTPPTNQKAHPGGQVGWHPGFRSHQLTGRVLAFTILKALQDAINVWSEVTITGGHPLPDEYWHVTDYYKNIIEKTRNLDPSVGSCHDMRNDIPERVCSIALKGRTEYTPRANPDETSLTSIIKPTPDGYIPKNEDELLYDGEDVRNPALEIPEDAIDVHAILLNRRKLENLKVVEDVSTAEEVHFNNGYMGKIENRSFARPESTMLRGPTNGIVSRTLEESIVPGNGWEVNGVPPGNCDGTYSAICGRSKKSDCLLYGHMDNRGGIIGNAYSGWLVMNLKDLKEGIIIIKIETWHKPEESLRTKGWTEVNNGQRYLDGYGMTDDTHRRLEGLPDTLFFDFAIDGKVTSWNKDEFEENRRIPQRVPEIWTLLDDSEMAKKGESKDVELAIRMRGCARDCSFQVTHVYWA
mmetsp:Transcript_15996/g.23525  ORF Transcript_15996/g.23525 Transcript_15996/m.23525 type:complete len:935 (+) Transcript_15996:62-2866(+)